MQRPWWPSCVVAIPNGVFLPRQVPSPNMRGPSWWPRPHRPELWGLRPQGVCKSCQLWWSNSKSTFPMTPRWATSRSIPRRPNFESPRPFEPEGPKPCIGWPQKSGPGGGTGVWPSFAAKPMPWHACFPLRPSGLPVAVSPQHSLDTPASAGPSKPRPREACPRPNIASRFFRVHGPKRFATTCH